MYSYTMHFATACFRYTYVYSMYVRSCDRSTVTHRRAHVYLTHTKLYGYGILCAHSSPTWSEQKVTSAILHCHNLLYVTLWLFARRVSGSGIANFSSELRAAPLQFVLEPKTVASHYAVLSVAALLLAALNLPETRGQFLPDDIPQVRNGPTGRLARRITGGGGGGGGDGKETTATSEL